MKPLLFLLGYRTLSADADNATDFLNVCLEHQIGYSSFRGNEDGSVRLRCSLKDAAFLQKTCEQRGVSVKAVGEGGLPVALKRRKKRAGLLLGGLCGVLLLVFSGQFVWDVRITGNETVKTAEIRELLTECGISVGSYLPEIRTAEVENRVLMRSDRLSWISVRLNGTVAEVQVLELKQGEEPEKKTPANLIAKSDGQIEEVEVFRGNCAVKPGQAVKAGEILVSGIYDSQSVGCRFTRASGHIYARTERAVTVEVPLRETVFTEIARHPNEVTFSFFGFSRKIFKSTGNKGGNCDIIKIRSLERFGLPRLPLSLTVAYCKEESETLVSRTAEEATRLAYLELEDRLSDLSADVRLLNKQITTEVTEDHVILVCRILCIEDISQVSEIEMAGM